MTDKERLIAFISALKIEDQSFDKNDIQQKIGSLKDVYRMLRNFKDKYLEKYKDFCNDTKDAIDCLEKESSNHGVMWYPALWDLFAKPEVIADLERFLKGKNLKSKSVIGRFSFAPGQVLFDNEDLQLPTGLTIDVFSKIFENFGSTVLYEELSDDSAPGIAGYQLRRAKSSISNKLSEYKVPCKIVTKPREGYCLCETTLNTKPHKRATKKTH